MQAIEETGRLRIPSKMGFGRSAAIWPLASQSINRYLGNEPFIRRLGGLREPLIEMALLTGIGIFICVREDQRLRTVERLRAAEATWRGGRSDGIDLPLFARLDAHLRQ